ncbi:hypothetical protein P280DRAFT_484804 [Massarina eburnea CBS 473.64]|uniref:Uncharacterized protein n=1 Tax=Massarina eburnea CBS 473.64 TaxID=1395130 RepID=A0A6A6RL88_9PLEO|nr:hypothetical protein P280DRAFT_484804 [Massarina eburnea CBS 473.64]
MAETLPSSRLQRALPASVFLILAGICFYLMDILSFVTKFEPPGKSGVISHANGETPILQEFHWIGFLDEVFKDVTVGFAPSSFGYNDVSRWQMSNFMSDVGVAYVIFGLESLRMGIKGGPIYYPALFSTLAQVGGGGVFVTAYYFFNIVYGIPATESNVGKRKIDITGAWIFLFGILIFSNIPLAGIMFAPTYEQRHWWTWFWQLYPLRITIFYYAVLGFRRVVSLPNLAPPGYQMNLRLIMTPLILSPALMWVYTLVNCPYPLSAVFWPQPVSDLNIFDVNTWGERMKNTMVYDEIFVNGSTLLWLALSAQDLKELVSFIAISAVLLVVVGPGATVGIMWCLREGRISRGVDRKKM